MDICAHPMVCWVYQVAKKIKDFDDVVVDTDAMSIDAYKDLIRIRNIVADRLKNKDYFFV